MGQTPIQNPKSKIQNSLDGILIVDKPAGLTSHDVIARVRRILKVKRVGHTGTLDPFATGVLVVLVGRATRLAQFLSGAEKEYEAVIRLGFATETGDATGQPRDVKKSESVEGADDERRTSWNLEEVEAGLDSLRGEIKQVPPMYSAKKVQGKKLYELARRGEEIERAPVNVKVSEFEMMEANGAGLRLNAEGVCDLPVRVVCSAGTYVRTLAESFGEKLGTGAHLIALRRTRAGAFKIEEALSLEEIARMAEGGEVRSALRPLEMALHKLPFLHLSGRETLGARHGASVGAGDKAFEESWANGQNVALLDAGGSLIAVGRYDAARRCVNPRVVLTAEKED